MILRRNPLIQNLDFRRKQMQLIHDSSKPCEYFCKGVDFVLNQSIKKNKTRKRTIEIDESSDDEFFLSQKVCLVATTEKDSIEWLKEQITNIENQRKQVILVIVDYFRDSMITSKYIKESLLRGTQTIELNHIILVEFFENDYIVRIEDTYDHCYSYKRLSRGYKKRINQVIQLLEKTNTVPEIETRKIRRKSYANRSMV